MLYEISLDFPLSTLYSVHKNGSERFKESPSMATAEYGGDQLHLTEGLRHRREYESSNPTSQTLGTLVRQEV